MKKLLAILLTAAMAAAAVIPVTAEENTEVAAFVDELEDAPEAFLSNTNYPARYCIDPNLELANDLGADVGTVYRRVSGGHGGEPAIGYKVNPEWLLKVKSYDVTEKRPLIFSFSADGNTWTTISNERIYEGNINDRQCYTNYITVPDGMNYVRICMPYYDSDGNAIDAGSRWCNGIRSVELGKSTFVDELEDVPEAFLSNANYPARYCIDPNLELANDLGDDVGTVYRRVSGGHGGEPAIGYKVNPEWLLKVKSYDVTEKRPLIFSFSADGNTWTTISNERIYEGNINDRQCYTNYITVPDGMNYVRICMPYYDSDGNAIDAGSRWCNGIRSVELGKSTFVDELEDAPEAFLSNANYPARYCIDPNLEIANDLGDDVGTVYRRVSGGHGGEPAIGYKVNPEWLLKVKSYDVTEKRPLIFSFSADGNTWTTISNERIYEGNINDRQCYTNYITVPDGMNYVRICMPYYDSDKNAIDATSRWCNGIRSVELRSSSYYNYKDELNTESAADFTNPSATGYIQAREEISPANIFEIVDRGGTIGLGYQHVYGHKDNCGYLTYNVYPGYMFNVVYYALNEYTKFAGIEFYDGNEWITANTAKGKASECSDSNGNTYIQNTVSAVVPEGVYLARAVLPSMDTDGDNWKFGLTEVMLQYIEKSAYECTNPDDTAMFEDGYMIVSPTVTKNNGDDENITVILAAYDQNKVLTSVAAETKLMSAGDNIFEPFLSVSEAAAYKLFVWSGVTPVIGNAFDVTVTQ